MDYEVGVAHVDHDAAHGLASRSTRCELASRRRSSTGFRPDGTLFLARPW